MIRSTALLAAALTAGAAAAQDAAGDPTPGWPAFDGALVDACLRAQDRQDGRPESCIGKAADACMAEPGADTTVGTSYCLGREYQHWDDLLNRAYQAAMADARAIDAEMADLGSAAEPQTPLLQDMQRQWIGFRDAACAFEHSRWGGGTGGGPAANQCALTLTARQALWLDTYHGDIR